MFSIRARTFSPSSSRLMRSFGVSGSRWPSAHWPWPLWALLRSAVVDRDGVARTVPGGTVPGWVVLSVAAGGAMAAYSVGERRGSTTAPGTAHGRDRAPGRTGAAGQPRRQTALDT